MRVLTHCINKLSVFSRNDFGVAISRILRRTIPPGLTSRHISVFVSIEDQKNLVAPTAWYKLYDATYGNINRYFKLNEWIHVHIILVCTYPYNVKMLFFMNINPSILSAIALRRLLILPQFLPTGMPLSWERYPQKRHFELLRDIESRQPRLSLKGVIDTQNTVTFFGLIVPQIACVQSCKFARFNYTICNL